MPITKEFTIRLEDRPGTLGKLCQALAEQESVSWWTIRIRPGRTLDRQRNDYTETEVARVMLENRPGELARVASRLGDKGINTGVPNSSKSTRLSSYCSSFR
jgi:hypothetical protein